MCMAFLTHNSSLMENALSDPDYPDFVHNKKDAADFLINVYKGFKDNSERSCNGFSTNNLVMRSSCKMLFGDGNMNNEISSLAADIAIAKEAKRRNDSSLCKRISNGFVKDACLDPSCSDSEIVDRVWH